MPDPKPETDFPKARLVAMSGTMDSGLTFSFCVPAPLSGEDERGEILEFMELFKRAVQRIPVDERVKSKTC